MHPLVVLLTAVVLAGCAGPSPLPAPLAGPVPELLGTWRGTWGGEPAALLVTEQTADAGHSGVFVGGYHLGGPRRPGISGVLTSTIRGTAVSSRAEGWIGRDATGRPLLLVETQTPDGSQRLTLARVDPDHLQGTGESSFRWGPRGPAQLTRQPR